MNTNQTTKNNQADKEKLRRQVESDADDVISKVGESKKAFQMSMHFFAYQVAISSFTNIIGTVMGHPLDTIRVSSKKFSSALRTRTSFSKLPITGKLSRWVGVEAEIWRKVAFVCCSRSGIHAFYGLCSFWQPAS